MFRKAVSVLTLSFWMMSAVADEGVVSTGPAPVADCPAPCPTPCSPRPAPEPVQRPAPCQAPCPPKPCAPKPCPTPCRKPCPPKPCCNPPNPCCWNYNPCNPKGCTDMNCGGLFFAADFLYWRAENHGFSYAYQFTNASSNVGTINRLKPQWDPAFRVGLGWNTSYDFWDVFLNYTWVRNRVHQSKTSAIGFVSLWPVSTSSTGTFSSVSAKSRFMLNIGDLEIGRLVYLTKSIAIRPHLGARGGTIHQKFNSDFTAPLSGSILEQTFSGKQNYWGAGPRTGVSGEWHLSQGFSLLAKAAGALLYGKNDVTALTQTRSSTAFTVERKYQDYFYQLVPNMQLLFGFQWQTCFWCEKMFFKMSASWETNYWWDQFNLPVALAGFSAPQPTVGGQALTMEGLTVNFEWDF